MDQILYFVFVWSVSAAAGVCRCVHNGDYRSLSHGASVAGVSGFLGFAVVALLCDDYSRDDFNPVYYLGIAAIVGLAGKEQTELITIIWRGFVGKLRGK